MSSSTTPLSNSDSNINQTGSGAFLYRSGLNGDVSVFRKEMKNEELSVDFIRDSFGDVMDTRRKKRFQGYIFAVCGVL